VQKKKIIPLINAITLQLVFYCSWISWEIFEICPF